MQRCGSPLHGTDGFKSPPEEVGEGDHMTSSYIDRLRNTLQESYRIARENAVASSTKMKETFDKATKDAPFVVGDKVLLANKAIIGRQKLVDKWLGTPYTVVNRMSGQHVYIVRDPTGKEKTVHRNLLTACTFSESDDDGDYSDNVPTHDPPDDIDVENQSRRPTRQRRAPQRYSAT